MTQLMQTVKLVHYLQGLWQFKQVVELMYIPLGQLEEHVLLNNKFGVEQEVQLFPNWKHEEQLDVHN